MSTKVIINCRETQLMNHTYFFLPCDLQRHCDVEDDLIDQIYFDDESDQTMSDIDDDDIFVTRLVDSLLIEEDADIFSNPREVESLNVSFSPVIEEIFQEDTSVEAPLCEVVVSPVMEIFDIIFSRLILDDLSSYLIVESCGGPKNVRVRYKYYKELYLGTPYPRQMFDTRLDLCREGIEPNPGPLTRQPPKRTRRKPKTRNRKKATNQNNPDLPHTNFMLPKQTVQRKSEMVEMSFALGSTTYNNPGGPIVVESYYTNDGFDVFPSILTPTIPLINNKFQLYKFCKVIGVQFEYVFTTLEQFPVDLYFFSSAQSMSAIFSSRSAVDTMATLRKPLWTGVLSEQYGKSSKLSVSIGVSPWRALGNKREYLSSNDFSFTQSSNPARLTHASLVAVSPTSTLSNGIIVRTFMNFKFLFYDPIDLTIPLLLSLKEPKEENTVDDQDIIVNGICYKKKV